MNRLKSADFSGWNGNSWTSTLAHDLASIAYDASGNLTALQRYRETGSLVDNLTYAYPAGSNRLSSVSDAVGSTPESWDAETGSFSYDANGNVLTAPAPYGISAVTYDHQNLPLSLTSNGVASSYRYDDAGQRIIKQVGGGNTEVYVLDGASSLGVVTVNGSGTPTSWFFNVLAGDRVMGRQPNTGNRKYYHTDLLGSTRAVVEGTTVMESYDPEPWGLLMPGRTLGSGTKEGFTGKERDTESGLDYFGARLYMPALARWTSIDPLAEKHPEWSAYNYVLDNPTNLFDPDGRQIAAAIHNPMVFTTARAAGWRTRQEQNDWAVNVVAPVVQQIVLTHGLGTIAGGLSLRSGSSSSPRALSPASTTLDDAPQTGIRANAAKGAAFERQVLAQARETQKDVVTHVTVKTQSGVRTSIDVVGRDAQTGALKLIEAKSSVTAPLTRNQKLAHPEIEQSGGVVAGRGKPGYPGGTKIPPTKVEVVRPQEH